MRRSVVAIDGLNSLGGEVELRGHFLFNPYSLILGDRQAFVMPYFLNEAGALPVCVFQRDESGASLYWRYQRDALKLFEQSAPLSSKDFAIPSKRRTRTSRDPRGAKGKASSVFISYSHRDRKWLDELSVSLKPYIRQEQLDTWDDTRLRGGDKWKEQIQNALHNATVAVLLVSRYFFASDFIVYNELQPLLDLAKRKGVSILWVAVSASAYERSQIGDFQALNDPSRPLDALQKAQRSKWLVTIAEKIFQATQQV